MPDIVRVEHLSYIYGQGMPDATVALDDISFSIEEGSFVGVIGSTGCGKSTLIGHFNGINRPTQGKVYIDGEDIWQDPKDIRRFRFLVGLVFQYPEYQLFEETVYKDIAFGPLNMGLSEEEVNRRVLRAAKFCGLGAAMLSQSPFELSGGQKRRAAIAGVLAMEPKLLVLDEPAAGLDPEGRDTILSQVKQFHQETGTTVVLVSHSMDEIARNVDRILVLKNAHILMEGTPQQVFARGEELLSAGLDVPQVTRVAMALRARGLNVDPAVYTVEALERELLALRKGGAAC